MKIVKTGVAAQTPLTAIVYGYAGVGKTTLASQFPKPLFFDFESGTRHISREVDVVHFSKWISPSEAKELPKLITPYETIVVDSLSEAMTKLIASDEITGSLYRQSNGNGDLTMAGWGFVKKTMRAFISFLRDSQKNVLLLTHVEEMSTTNDDGGQVILKRPMIATKISEEIPNMVDVVGYLCVHKNERIMYVGGSSEKVISKDRTGKLPATITNPTWNDFKDVACCADGHVQGNGEDSAEIEKALKEEQELLASI